MQNFPLGAAIRASFAKLDPRLQLRNPVMFVVEIGAAITTFGFIKQLLGGAPLGGGDEPAWFTGVVSLWLWLTVVFANLAEALAEGRGKAQADALRALRTRDDRPASGRRREARIGARARRRGHRRGRRDHPRRRHRHRGHRLGRRVGRHGRVGARDQGVRRRPLRRHRRHARALRPHRRRDHPAAGPELPRAHDRARRGRRAAEDAERDRARDPARGDDADLPRGCRDPAAVRGVRATPTSRSRR